MSKQDLYAKVGNLEQENTVLNQQNKTLQEELEYQKFVVAKLQRILFGSTSERVVPPADDAQISLFDQDQTTVAEAVAEETETITYERKKASPKKRGGRIPLPADLPRIEIVIEPEVDTAGMVKVREEITEILDIIPPVFQVIRIVRPIYAHPQTTAEEESVAEQPPMIIADLPTRPIDKGIPSARLLAYLLVSKFVDHLPYYRQVQMFQRAGVQLNTKTINGWIARVCTLLKVLYDAFCEQHFQRPYLQADETTIKVLKTKKSKKKGKAHTGYYWVYYDPLDDQVAFLFDPGRGRQYPAQHLRHFQGRLQTDGLSLYNDFDKIEGVSLFGCMAHVRRKFFDAQSNDQARAGKVLGMIRQLYQIEATARENNYTAVERLTLRQQKAVPIMTALKTYLDQQHQSGRVLPKSAFGIAIRYALGQWWKLERYLDDGTVEIDNNLVENAIRPVALGRKNYLFAGSEQGAHWGAIVYTLVASAIRQGHEPVTYLADVLRRLPDTKKSQLHELFPVNWTPRPPADLDLL